MNKYITYIKLGLVVVITAMVYACGSDPISSPPSPPLIPIANEIKEDPPKFSYKEGEDVSAQAVFSKGDIDNPYLFSFKVESVHLIEEIRGEIRITETGDTNKVFYEEKKMAIENSFGVVVDTATERVREMMEGMYLIGDKMLKDTSDFEDLNDGNSEDSLEDLRYFREKEMYIVGIGPTKDDPVDFSKLGNQLTVRMRILYGTNMLKEETVDVNKADPHDIYTWRDLQHVNDDLDGDYTVKTNIIFPEIGHYGFKKFNPIGRTGTGFTGIFEGSNHKIEGLYIDSGEDASVGLFGVAKWATIRNVKLYHVGIKGGSWVGGLVGVMEDGVISNSHVYALEGAEVEGGDRIIGGLIGAPYYKSGNSVIEDSSAHTDVRGYRSIGGLAGTQTAGTIIRNSYATGDVYGNEEVGGFIGYATASQARASEVVGVYATGNVEGKFKVGGLAGAMRADTIVRGHATGDVKGIKNVGGLIGWLVRVHGARVLEGYSSGNVEGDVNVGGLIGKIEQIDDATIAPSTIVNGYSVGNVLGNSYIGGLVGAIKPRGDNRWDVAQRRSLNNLHEVRGYARGKVIMTKPNLAETAGLLIGNVHAPTHGKSDGYISADSSSFVGVDGTKVTGIGGTNITIAAVTGANYRSYFKELTFGSGDGEWTWVGDGKWPAINVGRLAPSEKQPLRQDEVTPLPELEKQEEQGDKISHEQSDKALQGIEILGENKFKVYETHGLYYEKKRIKNRIPQIDFLPTGLYIKPNATITVTVESDYSLGKLRLFSGTYSRHTEKWDPDGFTLKKGKNVIVNTRGVSRLIYLRLTSKLDRLIKTATVTIEGASKAPFFIHGKTKSADFQKMLEKYDYESVLIASDRIMLVVSKEKALRVKNQDWAETASLLDKAVERSEYIHGLDDSTNYYDVPPSTRILAVERDEDGGPWSATVYRIMAPRSGIMEWIDNTKIVKSWSLWHEIGHMYEPSQILMGEVNVNIYSLAVEREFRSRAGANQTSRLVRGKYWDKIKEYLAKPEAEKDFDKIDVFWKLGMLQQLWLGYGNTDAERDQFYIKLHKQVRKESLSIKRQSKESLAYLMLKASEVYGRNLNDFFKAWGLKLPQEAFDAVDAFSSTKPTVDLTTLSE